jgi:hypothetical protein
MPSAIDQGALQKEQWTQVLWAHQALRVARRFGRPKSTSDPNGRNWSRSTNQRYEMGAKKYGTALNDIDEATRRWHEIQAVVKENSFDPWADPFQGDSIS